MVDFFPRVINHQRHQNHVGDQSLKKKFKRSVLLASQVICIRLLKAAFKRPISIY